jgi:hypothetical protein
MNKLIQSSLIASVLFLGNAADALTIVGAGGFDTFLASANIDSGQASEEAWVASILGLDATNVSMTYRDEDGANLWEQFSDSDGDDYYFDFGSSVDPIDHFVLKLGNGGPNITDSHYLFQNIGDTQYAAVSFAEAGVDFTLGGITIDRISHTSEFDTGGTTTEPVPEPSTIAMFGAASLMLGFVSYRSRNRKS